VGDGVSVQNPALGVDFTMQDWTMDFDSPESFWCPDGKILTLGNGYIPWDYQDIPGSEYMVYKRCIIG